MKKTLDDFTIDEIIEHLADSCEVFTSDKSGARNAMEFVWDHLSLSEILNWLGRDKVAEELIDEGYSILWASSGENGPSFYRHDCIELLKLLIHREGFDFVYRLIEKYDPMKVS